MTVAVVPFCLGHGQSRPEEVEVVARTRGERFEIRTPAGWVPFYVQGVNLGLALPGRFPAEFPTDSTLYAGWLDTISAMRANTVRTYTILPPMFYGALRDWNRAHPDRVLWLLQGVWTELPPGGDFQKRTWKSSFRDELRRAVDVVHGATAFARRPGHAGGRYDADVSAWTLGYIVGREWEPYAVQANDARRPGPTAYAGRYLRMARGSATEAWMAEQCDYLLTYEAAAYHALRPIAYTNWPTLDPLSHPTESTADEERRYRPGAGDERIPGVVSHEEDVVSLDASLIAPASGNPAGWFASYHVYPYYPDFMNNDPRYRSARSLEGRSNYFGYLKELVQHHRGMPLLVAEYGVPSSRGMAHLQPQGWSHGGHDELEMAAIDARLTREIRESGAAGGLVFAWMDEWFKRNWMVSDYETPAEHTPRWHNAMDPEQHYGILAQRAGAREASPALGGRLERWVALPELGAATREVGPLRLGHDEAHVYLALTLGPEFDWDSLDLQIALDTYGTGIGQRRLAGGSITSEIGFEFLVDLHGPADAEVQVTPDYNPYAPASAIVGGDDRGRFHRHAARSVARDDGRFDSLYVTTNRARYGRDGTLFPAQGYNRGRLRYGRESESTLADWYYEPTARLLELRLPWGLLNVTDPSSAAVLDERDGAPFATATTDGFRVGVVLRRRDTGTVVATLPAARTGGIWAAADFQTWRWPAWSEPTSHAELKPVYDSLKALWSR